MYKRQFEGKPFKSVTQGAADLAQVPTVDGAATKLPETPQSVSDFIAFAKSTLGDTVSDVRSSDRLTESAVCLVAPEQGYDRQLEKLLQGAGRLDAAAKPILEINPAHGLITALASGGSDEFRTDAVKILLDQARVLDGDKPQDPRAFADRLSRLLERALKA